MPEHRLSNGVPIDEIGNLYNRANGYYLSRSKKLGSRGFEAFLMLATLLEGVITLIGLKLLKKEKGLKELYSQREGYYTIDNAISDIYLLGGISTDEFKKLKQFQKNRNKFFHRAIFEMRNEKDIEENAYNYFKEYEGIFISMIKKLEEI